MLSKHMHWWFVQVTIHPFTSICTSCRGFGKVIKVRVLRVTCQIFLFLPYLICDIFTGSLPDMQRFRGGRWHEICKRDRSSRCCAANLKLSLLAGSFPWNGYNCQNDLHFCWFHLKKFQINFTKPKTSNKFHKTPGLRVCITRLYQSL